MARVLPPPPEIQRLIDDPLAWGEALGYRGDATGRKRFGPLHRRLVDHALSGPRTFTIVPRGLAKSTLLSVILPSWKLLRDPDRRILVASATLDLAKKLVGELRDRLNGQLELAPGVFAPVTEVFPWLALSGGDLRKVGPTSELNVAGRTSSGGREPSIFTGAVKSNLAGNHPTDLHIDDISNEQNTRTVSRRHEVIQFLRNAVPLLRYPHSPVCGAGTPWAFGDVVEYVEGHTDWQTLRFGCWDGVNPGSGLADGAGPGPGGSWPLCPSFLNAEEIYRIQSEEDAITFAAQYLCAPIPAEQALFTPPLLAAATEAAAAIDLRGAPEVLLWDPTHRVDGLIGDANGLLVCAVRTGHELGERGGEPRRNHFFPTLAHEIQGGTDAAMCWIEDLVKRRPSIRAIWVEKQMAQENLVPWLEERGRIGNVKVRPIKIRRERIDYRLMSIVTALRKGFVRLPEKFEGRDLLVQRLLEFPLGDSDDLLAAFALLGTELDRLGQLPGLPAPLTPDWAKQAWPSPKPQWP